MKKFFALPLAVLFVAACSDSTAPVSKSTDLTPAYGKTYGRYTNLGDAVTIDEYQQRTPVKRSRSRDGAGQPGGAYRGDSRRAGHPGHPGGRLDPRPPSLGAGFMRRKARPEPGFSFMT